MGLDTIAECKDEFKKVKVVGDRTFNPGWNLAIDLRNMLTVSEAIARAASMREESRGGHTRLDFPKTDKEAWGKVNIAIRLHEDGAMTAVKTPLPQMPADLAQLLED